MTEHSRPAARVSAEKVTHPAPPGPPGPPSHTHDDGMVCYFDSMRTMRWWSQEKEWPHKPVKCPGLPSHLPSEVPPS
jgi:hypothetical protein